MTCRPYETLAEVSRLPEVAAAYEAARKAPGTLTAESAAIMLRALQRRGRATSTWEVRQLMEIAAAGPELAAVVARLIDEDGEG